MPPPPTSPPAHPASPPHRPSRMRVYRSRSRDPCRGWHHRSSWFQTCAASPPGHTTWRSGSSRSRQVASAASRAPSQPFVIREPTLNHLIQGGIVIVSGLAKPSQEFMLVELVTSDGSVVGYRQAFVTPAPDGSYVPFTVEVPYAVTSGTWVRLQISESGVRTPGVEHLSTVEVYLSP